MCKISNSLAAQITGRIPNEVNGQTIALQTRVFMNMLINQNNIITNVSLQHQAA